MTSSNNGEALAYCPACRCERPFETQVIDEEMDYEGLFLVFSTKQAICASCGGEAAYAPYQEEDGRSFSEALREAKGLVTQVVVDDLPQRYDIGKRPLSKLLGWGELTYKRFADGCVPSKEYSDRIARLHADPHEYYELLSGGRDRISERAFRRSEAAVLRLLGYDGEDGRRLFCAADYLCAKFRGDLTHSALQRLLYYAQGFSFVSCERPLFATMPRAGACGPEYRLVAHDFGKLHIERAYAQGLRRCSEELPREEALVLDGVASSLGCFSGSELSRLSREEDPWRRAVEGGKGANALLDPVIAEEDMRMWFAACGM